MRFFYRFDKKSGENTKEKSSMRDMNIQKDMNDTQLITDALPEEESIGWTILKTTVSIFIIVAGLASMLIIPC